MKRIKITDPAAKKSKSGFTSVLTVSIFVLVFFITSCSNDKKKESPMKETTEQFAEGVKTHPVKNGAIQKMIAGSKCGECHSGINSKEFQIEHANPKKNDALKIPGTAIQKKKQ